MWVQLSTTCNNLLKYPNRELLVAVDHNQLRRMASETVDSIDWSHSPPYTEQYPLSSTYCTGMQCGLQITRFAALSEPRTCDLRDARLTHCLWGHSEYKWERGVGCRSVRCSGVGCKSVGRRGVGRRVLGVGVFGMGVWVSRGVRWSGVCAVLYRKVTIDICSFWNNY